MSGIEFPDDFVSCQLAVKKAECPIVLIRKGMDRLTQGIILGKTAVCSNPKTAGVRVLPECLAELLACSRRSRLISRNRRPDSVGMIPVFPRVKIVIPYSFSVSRRTLLRYGWVTDSRFAAADREPESEISRRYCMF